MIMHCPMNLDLYVCCYCRIEVKDISKGFMCSTFIVMLYDPLYYEYTFESKLCVIINMKLFVKIYNIFDALIIPVLLIFTINNITSN